MISVVVPTFNRAHTLSVTLDSLTDQRIDHPYEIIVVDDNSSDETRSVVQAFEYRAPDRVRYVFEKQQGSSAARNAGIAVARGEFLAFVDDDVIAQPNWLDTLYATYRTHPDAWCVGGKVTLRLPEVLPSWFDPLSRIMTIYLSLQDYGDGVVRIEYPFALSTANFSVRRDALSQVGLFDTGLGRFGAKLLCGEDVELCYRIQRAGGGVYYCADAVVIHLVPSSRLTKRFFRKRAYWEGRTDGLFLTRDDRPSSLTNLGSRSFVMTKDWMKTLAYRAVGDSRRAFEYELAARKRLGYLQQAFLSRGLRRGTRQGSLSDRFGLKVMVVENSEGLEALGRRWNDVAERAGVSVFQTFEWQSAWWRSFAAGRSLYTITVWYGDELLGIAPFFLESVALGGFRFLRRIRFVGCENSDYLDVIAVRGYEKQVAEALSNHFTYAFRNWDVLELEDVPEGSTSIRPFLFAMAQKGCRSNRAMHHRCLSIALPSSAPEYLARLSAGTRRDLLYDARKLFGKGFEVEIASNGPSVEEAMDEFMALHERRWAAKGERGAFSDPRTKEFHREVARAFHHRGWLSLAFLRTNGHRVAANYEFLHGGKVYSYLAGLNLEGEWARFSPGLVLYLKAIERAIAMGMTEYDLLRGAEPYKSSLGANQRINWRYEIVAPRSSALFRAGLRGTLLRVANSRRIVDGRARAALRRVIGRGSNSRG